MINPFKKKVSYDVRRKNLWVILTTLHKEGETIWCKRALARDIEGNQLFSHLDPNVNSLCIYGMLYMINADVTTIEYLQRCAKTMGYSDIDRLNDLNDFPFILTFLETAFTALGGKIKRGKKK